MKIKLKPLVAGILTVLTVSGCVVKPVEIPRSEIIEGSRSLSDLTHPILMQQVK